MLSIFALSEKVIRHGRLRLYGRNFLLGNDDEVKAAVAKLDMLTKGEDRLVGAETLAESKRQGQALDGVAKTVGSSYAAIQMHGDMLEGVKVGVQNISDGFDHFTQTMETTMAEAETEKEQKRQEKLLSILNPSVKAQDRFDQIDKHRVDGTGDWIRREQFFKSWIDKTKPLLWVSGNPGAGKSFVAANIISYLRAKYPQGVRNSMRVSVGYFFFKDTDLKTQSFHQALCDMAHQICQNDPVYAKHISTTCRSPSEIETVTSAWRKLMVDFFIKDRSDDSHVYIVLDGIDEATNAERDEFLMFLKDLQPPSEETQSRIHMVLVGRPHLLDQITEALDGDSVPTIHVSGEKTSPDIEQYINASIFKSPILRALKPDLKSQIVTRLSDGAQGMFIWVDFMLQELYKKKRAGAIVEALNKAPRGLQGMLRHVLESFSSSPQDDDMDDLNELLAWVTCAQRPLKLGELDMILKLKSPTGDGLISLEASLRIQFASFFSLTRTDGQTTEDLQRMPENSAQSDSESEADEPETEARAGLHEGDGLYDAEHVTTFNSNPSTTEVAFNHASIGDFFRDASEGKVSAGEDHPFVGVNIHDARVSVCRTCLALICDDELRERNDDGVSMISYAQQYWQDHLRAIDRTKADAESKKAIGSYLAKMFRDDEIISRWVGKKSWRFCSIETSSLIQSWLEDPDANAGLNSDEKSWLKTAVETKALFIPITRVYASQWIEKSIWRPKWCYWFVRAGIELQKGTTIEEFEAFVVNASDIIRVAEWAGFEKNAEWYRRVAMTMRDNGLYSEALEQFERTLELDTNTRLARGGMALVYVRQENWKKAIEMDKFNEKFLLEQLSKSKEDASKINTQLHATLERMAESYDKLGKSGKSLQCLQRATQYKKNCGKCTASCIVKLWRARQYSIIIHMLTEMQEKLPGEPQSLFYLVLLDDQLEQIIEACTMAARETKSIEFLIEILRKATITARQEGKTELEFRLKLIRGNLYYTYLNKTGKALRIWTRIVDTAGIKAKEETMLAEIHQEAMSRITQSHFKRALAMPKDSPDRDALVNAMEVLVLGKTKAADEPIEISNVIPAAILLGQWYRLNGRDEDAKACFRAYVKSALQVLSDDDPDNDFEGYLALAKTLIAAKQDAVAIGILQPLLSDAFWVDDDDSTVGSTVADEDDSKQEKPTGDEPEKPRVVNDKPEEMEAKPQATEETSQATEENQQATEDKQQESNKAESDDEDAEDRNGEVSIGVYVSSYRFADDKLQEPITLSCDGVCGRTYQDIYGLAICRYCYDVGLCADCLKLVQENTMPINVCGSNHEWLVTPAPTLPIKKGVFIVDGKAVGLDDIKKRLREEWNI
jgi:tetratricopeptide (TPR) repeat protein